MGFVSLFRVQWDRGLAVVATALGFVMILIGWIGVSGTGYLAKQLPYFMSSAVGGIGLIGAGAVLWLSADLRDEWRELRRLRVLMSSQVQAMLDSSEPEAAGARRHAGTESLAR